MRRLALLLAALVAACAPLAQPRIESTNWRLVASENDRERLREWRPTFQDALDRARVAGFGTAIAAEGVLLEPDAALGGSIPNGRFTCRTLKIGARSAGHRDFVSYAPVPCRVGLSGAVQGLSVDRGAQRPSGFIFPADRLRSVFLGGLSLGDEPAAIGYGIDPDRDLAGWVERIDDARWRIVLPAPRLESRLDIIELIPAP